VLIIFLISCTVLPAAAQKQLVLLKNEDVVLRLYPGDEIVFKLKGSDRIWKTYVNNIFATSVMTHSDTIGYHEIERIYFRQSAFYNRIGSGLVTLGLGLFLVDQINVVLVNGEDPSLDSGVSTVSLTSVAVGLPMMLIKKKSQKLNHKYRLLTVEKGSAFYQPNPKGFDSPFLDQ
jgi:hypothetical protein